MQKKVSKLVLFKKLANLDKDTGESRIVDKAEFIGEYSELNFTNGGDWCRRSSFAKPPNNYKIATATKTGKVNLLWDASDDEKANVEKYFREKCNIANSTNENENGNGNENIRQTRSITSIKYIKSFGKFEAGNTTRAIRKDILEYYKTKSCVNCGSNSELQCDHKNGLYNDLRVLSLITQTIDDFQSLCRHCNCQKRQIEKKTRETNRRYGATNIPHLQSFGIDFIEGDETLDVNNPNTLRGTYWYDPIAFTKYIHMKLQNQHTQPQPQPQAHSHPQHIENKSNPIDANLLDKMEKLSISKKKKNIEIINSDNTS